MVRSFKLFSISILSFCMLAFSPTAKAFVVPTLTGPVMDQVGLLQPASLQNISEDLYQFKAKTGVQIQVLILKSLEDQPIENVAIQIFDQWKLGDQKKDNGILFLIAPNDRKLRIEVGQGLEGSVPDVIAKRIIADVVTPLFRRGQFDIGIQSGVASLQNYIVTGDEGLIAPEAQHTRGKIPASYLLFGGLILFGIIFMISPALAMQILFALLSGGRGGGRGGGGGGWSGGGGSSSGGGASGDW